GEIVRIGTVLGGGILRRKGRQAEDSFDELGDRSLMRHAFVNARGFGVRRNNDERQAEAEAVGLGGAAAVLRRGRNMIVPTTESVIGHEDRGLLPERALHDVVEVSNRPVLAAANVERRMLAR